MIYLVLTLVLLASIGVWLVLRLRQSYDYGVKSEMNEAPPLVIPVRASSHASVEPLPVPPAHAVQPASPNPPQALPPRVAQRAQEHATAPLRPPPGYQPPPPGWHDSQTNGTPANGASETHASETLSTSDKVVHTIPVADGTLQFLPGRLEIIDGEKRGRDIRFVRTWGEVPEITFGRVTGPPYRHVQLKSQTVSRQHARMQYVDGRWQLINLSQTNPVIVNGEMLEPTRGQCLLRDGDQIEMGEVIFRFRER